MLRALHVLLRALHLAYIDLYSRSTDIKTVETCFYCFNDEILTLSRFFSKLFARLAILKFLLRHFRYSRGPNKSGGWKK